MEARRRPLFARLYPVLARSMERGGMDQHRARLLDGLSGEVIEVGAGNGLNFAHYPAEVTRVVAVEPEPHLRKLAAEAAVQAPVPIQVVAGTAEELPGGAAAYDAAVTCLVLCSVPDQARALAELYRVLKPGGELRFLEHVRAEGGGAVRAAQRLADATVWPWIAGGCHTGRDTATAIGRAGFTVQLLDRFRFPDGRLPDPTAPHILGTAVRPSPAR